MLVDFILNPLVSDTVHDNWLEILSKMRELTFIRFGVSVMKMAELSNAVIVSAGNSDNHS